MFCIYETTNYQILKSKNFDNYFYDNKYRNIGIFFISDIPFIQTKYKGVFTDNNIKIIIGNKTKEYETLTETKNTIILVSKKPDNHRPPFTEGFSLALIILHLILFQSKHTTKDLIDLTYDIIRMILEAHGSFYEYEKTVHETNRKDIDDKGPNMSLFRRITYIKTGSDLADIFHNNLTTFYPNVNVKDLITRKKIAIVQRLKIDRPEYNNFMTTLPNDIITPETNVIFIIGNNSINVNDETINVYFSPYHRLLKELTDKYENIDNKAYIISKRRSEIMKNIKNSVDVIVPIFNNINLFQNIYSGIKKGNLNVNMISIRLSFTNEENKLLCNLHHVLNDKSVIKYSEALDIFIPLRSIMYKPEIIIPDKYKKLRFL